jgi:hypothetical protein
MRIVNGSVRVEVRAVELSVRPGLFPRFSLFSLSGFKVLFRPMYCFCFSMLHLHCTSAFSVVNNRFNNPVSRMAIPGL